MSDEEKLTKLKELGEKCKTATEFYDTIITGDFTSMPFLVRKFVNQIGGQILEIIDG